MSRYVGGKLRPFKLIEVLIYSVFCSKSDHSLVHTLFLQIFLTHTLAVVVLARPPPVQGGHWPQLGRRHFTQEPQDTFLPPDTTVLVSSVFFTGVLTVSSIFLLIDFTGLFGGSIDFLIGDLIRLLATSSCFFVGDFNNSSIFLLRDLI